MSSRWVDPGAQYSLLPTQDAEDADEQTTPLENMTASERWEAMRSHGVTMLERNWVQISSGLVILLNALVIGVETDYPTWRGWDYVENTFLLFFSFELLVRLVLITPRRYFAFKDNPEFIWNLFDFSIVSMGLLDYGASMIAPSLGSMSFATVFRIIRLCRILRMFRLIKFLKQLYLLAYGFVEAALAMFWVTLLMTFVLYVCGIVLARLYGHVPGDDPDHQFLSSRFGSVPTSMLTLFELMSSPDLGVYQDALYNHPSMLPFLILFIIFGSFGMIALLTGVISECMFEKNKAKIEEERMEREQKRERFQQNCSELFKSMDEEGTGSVSSEVLNHHRGEVCALLEDAGLSVTKPQLDQMFDALDNDVSGMVDSFEFENGVMQMCEDIRPMSIMELHNSIRRCYIRLEETNKHLQTRCGDIDDRLTDLVGFVRQIHSVTVLQNDAAEVSKTPPESAASNAAAAKVKKMSWRSVTRSLHSLHVIEHDAAHAAHEPLPVRSSPGEAKATEPVAVAAEAKPTVAAGPGAGQQQQGANLFSAASSGPPASTVPAAEAQEPQHRAVPPKAALLSAIASVTAAPSVTELPAHGAAVAPAAAVVPRVAPPPAASQAHSAAAASQFLAAARTVAATHTAAAAQPAAAAEDESQARHAAIAPVVQPAATADSAAQPAAVAQPAVAAQSSDELPISASTVGVVHAAAPPSTRQPLSGERDAGPALLEPPRGQKELQAGWRSNDLKQTAGVELGTLAADGPADGHDTAITTASASAVLEEFRGRLEEMAQQVRAEVQMVEAASGRMGELMTLQATLTVWLDNCSSALNKVTPVPESAATLSRPSSDRVGTEAPPPEAAPEVVESSANS